MMTASRHPATSGEPTANAFAAFIADQTGARKATVIGFDKLSGGAIQDNFGLTLALDGGDRPGHQAFVVRQDAPSGIAFSLNRVQEYAVLKAAHGAGVTTPEPLWLCEDPSISGQTFYVMSRANGSASPRQLIKAAFSDQQRRDIVHRLGIELANLHRVRPPREGLDFLPLPSPTHPAVHRISEYRRYLGAIDEPHPVLEWALNWLADQVPPAGPVVLCHNDFRTGNYMMDGDQLTAVLDWEFASWSDPAEDLGWLCCRSWRFGASHFEVGGVGHRHDLLESYREASGHPVEASTVSYWEVMALVRWAMIALQQAERHLSGQQRSLELVLTGRMVAQMESDLLDQIQELEATS